MVKKWNTIWRRNNKISHIDFMQVISALTYLFFGLIAVFAP